MSLDFKPQSLIAAIIISVGMVIAGYSFGMGLGKARLGERSVTVKGLSERDVKADLAVFSIGFTATGSDLGKVQSKIDSDHNQIIEFLRKQGLSEAEISSGGIKVTDALAQGHAFNAVVERYVIRDVIQIRSGQIDLIHNLSQKMNEFIKMGIVLNENWDISTRPTYLYTKLGDIKSEMLAEATKNARKAAETFASDSGSIVGSIRRANQGVFEITDRDLVAESMEGGRREGSIYKKVRVVTTIDYFLN